MNTVIVSRRVQWALLIFLILTLIVFAPLLLAVGIGLTVAITMYPFYYSLYRYFQISERSGRTETFFAAAITLLISFGFLVLLALPGWIVIENREDIIRGGREILERIEELDFGAMFAWGGDGTAAEELPADGTGSEESAPAAMQETPPPADAARPDTTREAQPPDDTPGTEPSPTGPTVRAAESPADATGDRAAPGTATTTNGAEGERVGEPLITPEQIKQAVTGLVTGLLSSIPMFLLSFFIFASVLYLGLRYGASLWRRLLIALELQTRDVLQRLAGTTYRTLYAIYVVHFTTVVITFVFAIPLFIWLGQPYSNNVLLWALICALFQLIPFLGPSLIMVALIALEFFQPNNADMWGNIAILFFYGYLIVTIVPDWIFRPLLMGRTTGQNSLVMWVGFFGGIAVMGPAGFVFGPLILALLNEGINIVLERYPDPMLRQGRRRGWDAGEPSHGAEHRQPFGEIGGQTSGVAFLSAGATAQEDAAIAESRGRPGSGSGSQGELPPTPPSPPSRGAVRLERPPAAADEVGTAGENQEADGDGNHVPPDAKPLPPRADDPTTA